MLREYKIKIMELKKALEMSNAGGKSDSSGGNGEGASSSDLSTELARVKANADKEKHEMEKMKRQLEILRSGIFSGRQDSKTMGGSGDRKNASRRGSVGGMKRRQSMIVRGSGLTGLFPSTKKPEHGRKRLLSMEAKLGNAVTKVANEDADGTFSNVLQAQARESRKRADAAEADRDKFKDMLAAAEHRIQQLEAQLIEHESVKQSLSAFETANKEWEKHFRKIEQMQADDLASLQKDVDDGRTKIREMELMIASKEIELTRLRTLVEEAEKIKLLEAEKEAFLETRLDAVSQMKRELAEKIDNLDAERQALQAMEQNVSQRENKARAREEEAERSHSEVEELKKRLQKEVAEAVEKNQTLKVRCKLSDAVPALQRRLRYRLRQRLIQQESQLRERSEALLQNKSDVARREVAVRELEAAVQERETRVQEDLQRLQEQQVSMKTQREALRERADAVEARESAVIKKESLQASQENNIVYRESRIQDLHDELTKRQMAFDDEVDSARVLLQQAAEKRKELEEVERAAKAAQDGAQRASEDVARSEAALEVFRKSLDKREEGIIAQEKRAAVSLQESEERERQVQEIMLDVRRKIKKAEKDERLLAERVQAVKQREHDVEVLQEEARTHNERGQALDMRIAEQKEKEDEFYAYAAVQTSQVHGRALREMEEQVKMALQSVETYRRKAETAEKRVAELEQSVAGSASSSADSAVAIDTIALALQTARGVIVKNMHHADEKEATSAREKDQPVRSGSAQGKKRRQKSSHSRPTVVNVSLI
eukprot:g5154.t1